METKTKSLRWLLSLLSTIFLLSGLAACDSTEDSIEDPTKPEVPINEDDWQTVSTKGDVIKKDSLTLTLPSGTFKNDTKVAVTKVNKGQICGSNEVSEFYQITTPITTYKPVTIKIKSENLGNDASIVLHSYGFAKSFNEITKTNNVIETTYSNGEYTATLPAFANENDTTTISFSVGLAKASYGNANTRTPKGGFEVADGMVDDIGWKLYVDPSVDKMTDSWEVINNETHTRLGKYIEESIQKILDLGFTLRPLGMPIRYIYFYYISDPDKYGYFKQSPVDDAFSFIGIGVEKLKESTNDPSQLKSTLIHELFHYFQSDYDPREPYTKAGGFRKPNSFNDFVNWKLEPSTIDNESIIHEMASVWIEQFMNNGELNAKFLLEQVFGDVFIYDGVLGFGMEKERWNKGIESYQQQGYSMGPWLHFMLNEIKEHGKTRKDHPVLELFQLFKKKWKSGTYNSYYILEEWLKSYDDILLTSSTTDDYYLKLWQGNVVKDFDISKVLDYDKHNVLKNKTGIKKDDSKVSPFGCEVTKVSLLDYKDIKLDDKELVIKQEEPNVHTYVLLTDSKSNMTKFKYIQRNKVIYATVQNDSIVLSGKTLESLRLDDGSFDHQFFLVTTNISNKMHSKTVNPSHVSFELRDAGSASVSPTKLPFPSEGGTKRLTIIAQGYKKFGCEIDDKDKSWLSYEFGDGNTIDITAKSNTTDQPRSTKIRCYVTNDENSAEVNRVYLPVEVTQDGNISGGESNIIIKKIKSLVFMAQFTVQSSIMGTNTTLAYSMNPNSISFKQSGSTIHVSASEESGDLKETISFDIVNLTDAKYELHNSQIKNLNFYKYKNNGEETSIVLNDLANTYQNATLGYGSKVSTGLKVTSFSSIYRSGNSSIEYIYIDDPANSASVQMTYDFERVSSSRSIPNHGDRSDE